MITFIFSIGQQNRDSVVSKQVAALANLKSTINSATASLSCPNHGPESSATVLLSGFYYGSKWEVLNSCCADFKQMIESAVPLSLYRADGPREPG